MAKYELGSPTNNTITVTVGDGTDFSKGKCEYLRVGTPGTTTGNITVRYTDDTTQLFTNTQAGERIEAQCMGVEATATDATGLTLQAYFKPKSEAGL